MWLARRDTATQKCRESPPCAPRRPASRVARVGQSAAGRGSASGGTSWRRSAPEKCRINQSDRRIPASTHPVRHRPGGQGREPRDCLDLCPLGGVAAPPGEPPPVGEHHRVGLLAEAGEQLREFQDVHSNGRVYADCAVNEERTPEQRNRTRVEATLQLGDDRVLKECRVYIP